MINTPRTDDARFIIPQYIQCYDAEKKHHVVEAKFAEQLATELAEARAETERLKKEQTEDSVRLKNVFMEDYSKLKSFEDVIRNQDKLIEQMREALDATDKYWLHSSATGRRHNIPIVHKVRSAQAALKAAGGARNEKI